MFIFAEFLQRITYGFSKTIHQGGVLYQWLVLF